MVHLRKSIFGFALVFTALSFAQNIEKHAWKQRVLVILTHDKQQDTYKNQCAEFNNDSAGLSERKLVMYHVTPEAFALGTSARSWKPDTKFYNNYKKTKAPFEIVLIGLDGGIKLRQTKLLSRNDLYGIIDSMPMRRSELKNR